MSFSSRQKAKAPRAPGEGEDGMVFAILDVVNFSTR
jgi:hypothetical protein